MFVPMFVQDLSELLQEDPSLLPLAIPGAMGMGTQSYGSRGGNTRLLPESIFPRESDWIIPEGAR